MYLPVWIGIVSFLILDTSVEALPQKESQPLRCQQCSSLRNLSNCTQENLPTVNCLREQYCATIATAPNYTTTLTCANQHVVSKSPCTIEYKKEQIVMTCICMRNLCNVPFNQRLKESLLNYSTNYSANTSSDLSEMFFKFAFPNDSYAKFYELVTLSTKSFIAPVNGSTKLIIFVDSEKEFNVSLPKAEALKHEVTVPPDDDEDENEGSGTSSEDSKSAPSAPAAPSSYLPADKNQGRCLIIRHVSIIITLLCLQL